MAQVFSCKLCETFKRNYFYRTTLMAASISIWDFFEDERLSMLQRLEDMQICGEVWT